MLLCVLRPRCPPLMLHKNRREPRTVSIERTSLERRGCRRRTPNNNECGSIRLHGRWKNALNAHSIANTLLQRQAVDKTLRQLLVTAQIGPHLIHVLFSLSGLGLLQLGETDAGPSGVVGDRCHPDLKVQARAFITRKTPPQPRTYPSSTTESANPQVSSDPLPEAQRPTTKPPVSNQPTPRSPASSAPSKTKRVLPQHSCSPCVHPNRKPLPDSPAGLAVGSLIQNLNASPFRNLGTRRGLLACPTLHLDAHHHRKQKTDSCACLFASHRTSKKQKKSQGSRKSPRGAAQACQTNTWCPADLHPLPYPIESFQRFSKPTRLQNDQPSPQPQRAITLESRRCLNARIIITQVYIRTTKPTASKQPTTSTPRHSFLCANKLGQVFAMPTTPKTM